PIDNPSLWHPCELFKTNSPHRKACSAIWPTKQSRARAPGTTLISAFSQELPACSQQLRRKPARFRPLSKPGLRLLNGSRLGELASGERGFHRLRQCLAIAKGREHRECLRVDS